MRIQSDLRRPERLTFVVIIACALAAVAFASRPAASAQTPAVTTLQFTELDKGSTFKHIRNTKTTHKRANLLGDQNVFTNPLADAAGKVVGKLHAQCVTTVGSLNFMKSKIACSGILVVPGGTLTFQALVNPAAAVAGAITGGTGAYATARGAFTSVDGQGGTKDTITLAG